MQYASHALGVSWFVETDMFGFKVNIKEKPCTRRGILSVVSVVYDLLNMAGPLILPAKVFLLDWTVGRCAFLICRSSAVNRCVKGADLGEVAITEIHHSCDASQFNYRAV